MSWTEERVELLKTLWAEGLSASQIASRLGGVTRNAVIGKVHRLGLSGRATPARTHRPRRPRQPSHPARVQFRSQGSAALKVETVYVPEPVREPAPVHELEIPPAERVHILALNERTCRWPIGHPGAEDFYFCGREPRSGGPYCEHHARIAYQPLQERRRLKKG